MKIIRIFFLINLSILLINTAYSQKWIKTINGNANGDDKALCITTDKSGNVYQAGFITRITTGIDICVAKYNSSGVQQWINYYAGPQIGEDKAFGIVVDNYNNVFITGYSEGLGSCSDITVIKYNSSGIQQWVYRYNAPGNSEDKAFGIVADNAGNVFVTGYITQQGSGTDIYTFKLNSSGTYMWGQLYYGNANESDKAFGIVADQLRKNIYITGFSTDSVSETQYTTIKYDSSGARKWVKLYNGVNDSETEDKAFGIVVDNIGNIVVTGSSTSEFSGLDFATIKYDSSGNQQWISRDGGLFEDKAFGIVVDSLNNVFITGSSYDSTSKNDCLTMKYDKDGILKWASKYNYPTNSNDSTTGIALSKSSNFVFISGTITVDSNNKDIVTIKYDATTGYQLQLARYNANTNINEYSTSIAVDTANNVNICGYVQNTTTSNDWLIYQYEKGQIIKIDLISLTVPMNYYLGQNYPNPFNPSSNFKLEIPKAGIVKIKVFDVLGREVTTLVNEYLKAGNYEVTFNLPNISTGIYFYRLTTDELTITKKMILAK
jgi:hypothetical protein